MCLKNFFFGLDGIYFFILGSAVKNTCLFKVALINYQVSAQKFFFLGGTNFFCLGSAVKIAFFVLGGALKRIILRVSFDQNKNKICFFMEVFFKCFNRKFNLIVI